VNHHPTKRLVAPDGGTAEIDVLLVPLIEALWAAGYETIGSCQDLGGSVRTVSPRRSAYWKGYALIELPVRQAQALMCQLGENPQLRPHMHWAAPTAWEVSIPVIPDGGEILDIAQFRFPNDQIGNLVEALAPER
jgi:hypothetical protein